MMEKALQKFISYWKQKDMVRGILLTGSYAVGIETKNSDVDIRLVLDDSTTGSFKGLETIEGFTFSFIGRSQSITLDKFNRQFFSHVKMEARIYHIGKAIYDPYGEVAFLQEIAKNYVETPLISKEVSETDCQLYMHSLYKKYEYIQNSNPKDPFYMYNYILYLEKAISYYAEKLNAEMIYGNDSKLIRFLTDEKYIKTYGFPSFPDAKFKALWLAALNKREKSQLESIHIFLRKHLHNFNESSTLIEWDN
ncbi:nucleotidyltransferase domain-containing protein [Kordia zhangzhouensis]|uniref:nucleotidyltransferase domain-containing protein n=1 Tax=Kordia zhangzhouensis TaxID=1620405 RepID=UPI00062988A7|nr:nucleotidyltransferase domain-containing protein [Kordia zhangzhouensis]